MASQEDFELRALSDSDLPLVLQWRNSERIRANMYTDHLISAEEHAAWYLKAKDDPRSRHFVFRYKGQPVGVVNIVQIDDISRKCYWGFYLGDVDAPKVCGPAMEFVALEYMFNVLKMRKICCEVFVFNEPVIKLHKKFGFVVEGVFVKHILKNGQYEDVTSLAVFNDDWSVVRQKLERVCFRD